MHCTQGRFLIEIKHHPPSFLNSYFVVVWEMVKVSSYIPRQRNKEIITRPNSIRERPETNKRQLKKKGTDVSHCLDNILDEPRGILVRNQHNNVS